ncbi:MAG: YqjK family protein [Thiobacillus sp.]
MNNKRAQLAARRQQLVAQAAAQRSTLAYNLEPWRARLALADRGVAVLRYIGRTPALMMAGGALLLVFLRPGRAGKWLQRGLLVWQIGRRLR